MDIPTAAFVEQSYVWFGTIMTSLVLSLVFIQHDLRIHSCSPRDVGIYRHPQHSETRHLNMQGCLYWRENRHQGVHISVKIGTPGAHFWGCAFSHDTGTIGTVGNWGEPEQAPPRARAVQWLRCMSVCVR